MGIFEDALGTVDGGRVLDVATQEGRFVRTLVDNLRSYVEIVGIDLEERFIERAQGAFEDHERVSFQVMDAGRLEFEDESFDTVAISASLHHMADVEGVLAEMDRVLRPGGLFIVAEMHRDGLTEAERTSALLHRWSAEIDTAVGRLHNRTLSRGEILAHLERLNMRSVRTHDHRDKESDPMDPERLDALEKVIAAVAERAAAAPEASSLAGRSEELGRRLRETGALGEPVLVVLGEKRSGREQGRDSCR